MIEILATNNEPERVEETQVNRDCLHLFRDYMTQIGGNKEVFPYVHQNEVFQAINCNQSVFLVAGTAAGKTLAVGVPLFWGLKEGRIKKILFMYPTVALLEDQWRVMERLAKSVGLEKEIGRLQGGMPRSALVSSLNKRIILATPDEIYWFFRKNVKYNALLIYGLCQVNQFVLDEAHLFNGLTLRNFEHLWQRIRTLASHLGKTPQLHVLTATPTDELKRLNDAQPIYGKSRCYDVRVVFQTSGRFDRANTFANTINDVLNDSYRKVLVVCNSARMAHQLFEKYCVSDSSTIPVEHRLKFGKVTLGTLTRWLEKKGIEKELVEELIQRLFREEDICLEDLPNGVRLNIPLQDLTAAAVKILEGACWRMKRALWEYVAKPGESLRALVHNSRLPCQIIAAVEPQLSGRSLEDAQKEVDKWLAMVSEALSNIYADPISCCAKGFEDLTTVMGNAGLSRALAEALVGRLKYDLSVKPEWIVGGKFSSQDVSHRPIYLRWMSWMVEKEKADRIFEALKAGLETGELEVECRHIGLWKGTNVPIIVYSGSMAKQAREGLINVFADLDRAVLISTSAVEVGVDFHADVLITEECEGNSFLQRFGRVGRHDRGSKVMAFVSGDVYAGLNGFDREEISREDFSTRVIEAFPCRSYATGSKFLDASQYLVNEQLGRIGESLNAVPDLNKARQIAEKLRATDVQLGFGLRGTMPQITLRDGVAKDPFYLLRYVDDQDLRSADSPFEVARAQKWFTSLIFQRAQFDVMVDLEETLKVSRYVFIRAGDEFHIWPCPCAGLEYLRKMNAHFEQIGDWDKWHQGNFVLLHGDVYLSRSDREVPSPQPVTDSEQNPLFIPNQTYLVLWGWTNPDETRQFLENAGVADWEELHYDWDRLKHNWDSKAMVILEESTGACFAAYEELVDYVDRQVQK